MAYKERMQVQWIDSDVCNICLRSWLLPPDAWMCGAHTHTDICVHPQDHTGREQTGKHAKVREKGGRHFTHVVRQLTTLQAVRRDCLHRPKCRR